MKYIIIIIIAFLLYYLGYIHLAYIDALKKELSQILPLVEIIETQDEMILIQTELLNRCELILKDTHFQEGTWNTKTEKFDFKYKKRTVIK